MSNQISIQGKLLIKPKEDYNNEVSFDDIMELVNGLSKTKRITRDLHKIKEELEYNPDDYSINGYYYYPKNDFDNFGQTIDKSVINMNRPPMRAPSLWLDFEVIKEKENKNGKDINKYYLVWNGEQENNSIREEQKWIMSLIYNVFNPVKMSLNGKIKIIDKNTKNILNPIKISLNEKNKVINETTNSEILLEIKNNEIFKNNELLYYPDEKNLMAEDFFRNIIEKNKKKLKIEKRREITLGI